MRGSPLPCIGKPSGVKAGRNEGLGSRSAQPLAFQSLCSRSSVVPFDILTASVAVLALLIWIEGGRAHWTLMVQHDARFDDQAGCTLVAGVARGEAAALVVRASFIALWPAWLALGFVLAALDGLRQR